MNYTELDHSNYTIRMNRQVIERLKTIARELTYLKRENISIAYLIREALKKEYPTLFEGLVK